CWTGSWPRSRRLSGDGSWFESPPTNACSTPPSLWVAPWSGRRPSDSSGGGPPAEPFASDLPSTKIPLDIEGEPDHPSGGGSQSTGGSRVRRMRGVAELFERIRRMPPFVADGAIALLIFLVGVLDIL